jgi:hypothetical protein
MSQRERQQADLFFADLTGSARSRSFMPRVLPGRASPGAAESLEGVEATGTSRRLVQHPTLGYGWIMPTAAVMTPVAARPATSGTLARQESLSEHILGTDDRQLVTDTRPIAFRFVYCLDLLFTHPADATQTIQMRGTGTPLHQPRNLARSPTISIPRWATAEDPSGSDGSNTGISSQSTQAGFLGQPLRSTSSPTWAFASRTTCCELFATG